MKQKRHQDDFLLGVPHLFLCHLEPGHPSQLAPPRHHLQRRGRRPRQRGLLTHLQCPARILHRERTTFSSLAPTGSQGPSAPAASSHRDNPGGIATGIRRTDTSQVGRRKRRTGRSLGRRGLFRATGLADFESSSSTRPDAGSGELFSRRGSDSDDVVGPPAAPQPACGILPIDTITRTGRSGANGLRPGEVAGTVTRRFELELQLCGEYTKPEFELCHAGKLDSRIRRRWWCQSTRHSFRWIHCVQRRWRRRRSGASKASGKRNRFAFWAKATSVKRLSLGLFLLSF